VSWTSGWLLFGLKWIWTIWSNLDGLHAYRIQAYLSNLTGYGRPAIRHWKWHHQCDEQVTFTRCVDFYRLDVWPACDVSQRRTVLLPAASTPLSPSVVRHRIESITTLIRAFVSSRVDYCCSLLIGSPRSVSSHRQASARPHSSLLSAAARVIINTKKYESGLSRIL